MAIEDVEQAAYLMADIKTTLYAELVLSDDNLNKFDSQANQAVFKIRNATGVLIDMIDTQLNEDRNSLEAIQQAKAQTIEVKEYYAGLLGDLSNHKLRNADEIAKAKDEAETLAAAIENSEADLNQAIAVMELTKQVYTSARLNYEERVTNAILKGKEVYNEFSRNITPVYQKTDELAQLAEEIAL